MTSFHRALVVTLVVLSAAAIVGGTQTPQTTAPTAAPQKPAPAPKAPTSVLGATPPALNVPAPGPATDKPYAPQPIAQGGIVVPVFPPDSPLLKAARIKEPEVYNM